MKSRQMNTWSGYDGGQFFKKFQWLHDDVAGAVVVITSIAIIACVAAASGQLPKIINAIHAAQIQLIQDSKASKWPKAMLLPIKSNRK
jgi:hypothetical protein